MNKTLGMLGIAKKAGFLEIGEEPSGIAARSNKARALITASDAAGNTVRRVTNFAEKARIPHIKLPYTKDELGDALGINSCAAIAVTDAGMAVSIAEKLESEAQGQYTGELEELKMKSKKIMQRKREAQTHEKNLRKGKRASSEHKGRKING